MLRLLLMIFLLILATQWGNKRRRDGVRREAVEYRGVLRISSRWAEFCLARFGIGSGVGFFSGRVHCARYNRRIERRGVFLQIVDCSPRSNSRSRPSSQGGREQRTEVEGRRRERPFHDALGVKGQVELSRRERCRFCCMEGLDAREKDEARRRSFRSWEAEVRCRRKTVRCGRCGAVQGRCRVGALGAVRCSSECYYHFFFSPFSLARATLRWPRAEREGTWEGGFGGIREYDDKQKRQSKMHV
ncbi:hypothetical protein K456DRAFT_77675 [Colletotrichum gloeosporioides 23]|nr:hypothetical protein K456DRAFT_77675 [Colletotrichum gloeosporioides 23]